MNPWDARFVQVIVLEPEQGVSAVFDPGGAPSFSLTIDELADTKAARARAKRDIESGCFSISCYAKLYWLSATERESKQAARIIVASVEQLERGSYPNWREIFRRCDPQLHRVVFGEAQAGAAGAAEAP